MKKWLYFIAPAIMLVIFTFFYLAHADEVAKQEAIRQQQVEVAQKAEADRKAKIEEEARIDAEKRAAEQKAKTAQKEADRIAKWNQETAEIKADTAAHKAQADKYAAEISELEIQLDTLRKAKEKANTEELNLAKNVELARIAKRDAELEIQRKTELMVRRAEQSAATQMPAPVEPAGRGR